MRRLLGHRSGLPDYFFDERFQKRVQSEPNRMWRPVELVEAAAEIGRLALFGMELFAGSWLNEVTTWGPGVYWPTGSSAS